MSSFGPNELRLSHLYMMEFIYKHKVENIRESKLPIHQKIGDHLVLSYNCMYQLYVIDSDEHKHESDDEETQALMAKHDLMPGDRMRIEKARKKRHADRRAKERMMAMHAKPATPEINHVEMSADALAQMHADINAHSEDEDQFASEDAKKRAKIKKQREKKQKKKDQYRAVGEETLDQDALRKAAARRKKRAARAEAKPWDQPAKKETVDDADDEEEDDGK